MEMDYYLNVGQSSLAQVVLFVKGRVSKAPDLADLM